MDWKNNFLFIVILEILVNCLLAECGRIKRVIGGKRMDCGLQPRVASLQNSTTGQHLCGATIISPHFALTAAHCVTLKEDDYILQLNNYCVPHGGKLPTATVKKIIIHESFDPVTKAHDLALLRISLHLCEKSWLKESILSKSSFGLSGECTIYGYGYQDLVTKETSTALLSGKLRLVSLDKCRSALGEFASPDADSGMMCAVGDGVDACQVFLVLLNVTNLGLPDFQNNITRILPRSTPKGDSGSPLICAQGKLEGISSYGMSCGVPGLPGVYTSVAAHITWIRDTMKCHGP